jgi:hypothetical protein
VNDFKQTDSAESCPAATQSQLTGERGAALIIVLVMLLLLTILGTTLLSSSTTDIQIAGNYRNNQRAFYINDYAFELLKTNTLEDTVYKNSGLVSPGNTMTFTTPSIPSTGETATYKVTNLGCIGGAPVGSGEDADSGNYYNIYEIEITANASNNATAGSIVGNMYQRLRPCE